MTHKVAERERVHGQNRDLVTKNCGQASQIDRLKREAEGLQAKLAKAREAAAQAKPPTMLRAA